MQKCTTVRVEQMNAGAQSLYAVAFATETSASRPDLTMSLKVQLHSKASPGLRFQIQFSTLTFLQNILKLGDSWTPNPLLHSADVFSRTFISVGGSSASFPISNFQHEVQSACLPAIPTSMRLRQGDYYKSQTCLGYRVRPYLKTTTKQY